MEDTTKLIHGDCLEVLRTLPDCSVDAVVTDPPYGLAFMGKKWDYDVPSEDVWRECLRVLKPGGHLLAFAGTRTQHRMAVNIEDAGFEIRDMIAWVYGSGFPKSLDVSKAIDKAAGAEREVVGVREDFAKRAPKNNFDQFDAINPSERGINSKAFAEKMGQITAPATDAARQWHGWGTALKPAMEPITVARKPLEGTVAENVLRHGTGGINVDGCRVGTDKRTPGYRDPQSRMETSSEWNKSSLGLRREVDTTQGRWPANLIHDGSEEVVGLFPVTKTGAVNSETNNKGKFYGGGYTPVRPADSGSAARFFYCAKASKADRGADNRHPTVKPTALMRYLCRLVTPPGGTVLDPFMGSGSTGKAAVLEGFKFIGIEREAEYVTIATARLEAVA